TASAAERHILFRAFLPHGGEARRQAARREQLARLAVVPFLLLLHGSTPGRGTLGPGAGAAPVLTLGKGLPGEAGQHQESRGDSGQAGYCREPYDASVLHGSSRSATGQ